MDNLHPILKEFGFWGAASLTLLFAIKLLLKSLRGSSFNFKLEVHYSQRKEKGKD
jgi:hypothetical protein